MKKSCSFIPACRYLHVHMAARICLGFRLHVTEVCLNQHILYITVHTGCLALQNGSLAGGLGKLVELLLRSTETRNLPKPALGNKDVEARTGNIQAERITNVILIVEVCYIKNTAIIQAPTLFSEFNLARLQVHAHPMLAAVCLARAGAL